MCGIAGIFSKSRVSGIPELVQNMLSLQNHRGPDDTGYVLISENEIRPVLYNSAKNEKNMPYLMASSPVESTFGALGHNRLSIIDLSEYGHQPMSDYSGRYWITFNGEIYNYLELREKLKSEGVSFHSESDTEVVLQAYIIHGERCVDFFNGMWSFAIYDHAKKEIFCSRDRVGVKPFYYLDTQDYFAFASEIKPLLSLLKHKPTIDQKEFSSLFQDNKIGYSSRTLFKEVKELSPSSNLLLSLPNGDFESKKYYKVDESDCKNPSNLNIDSEADSLYQKILEAVRIRLRSDVEIGSCLSGGLDSSGLVHMMHDLGVNNLKTFTATQVGKAYDESKWAQLVSDKYNCDWHNVGSNQAELIRDFELLIKTHEYPILSLSTYAQFRVMSRVNEEGIKVVLDGQGADELFGGYPHHRSFYALDLLKKVNLKSFGELLSNQSQGFENSRILRDYYVYNLKLRFPSLSRRIFKNRLFEHDYIAKDLQEPLQEKVEPIASFNSVLLSDYYNGYLKNLLRYEDRNSMHFSVESRTTFADDVNLMQWFLKAPKKYFFRNGFSKYLFRKALDHKLPNAITWRKDKIGFQVPNNEWMWELTKEKKDLIHSLPVEYFDTDKIIKDFDQLFNRSKQPENFRILKFISFAQWYDVFIS